MKEKTCVRQGCETKFLANSKQKYCGDKCRAEADAERYKAYYAMNRRRILDRAKKSREANPSLFLARVHKYRKEHPDRYRESMLKYKAKNPRLWVRLRKSEVDALASACAREGVSAVTVIRRLIRGYLSKGL